MNRLIPACGILALALASVANAAPVPQAPWIVADFNGDHKADLVSVDSIGEPGIQFSASHSALPSLAPRFTAHLRARDLDGDNDRDLILETASSLPIAIWLNDGAGHFARANLEDFRFQLSHESTQTFTSVAPLIASLLTDDGPRADAVKRPGFSAFLPRSQLPVALPSAARLAGSHLLLRSRGPPSLL